MRGGREVPAHAPDRVRVSSIRRLEERQTAMLSVVDTRGRADRGVTCAVVAVNRAQVALYPLMDLDVPSLPATIGEVYLSFESAGALVAVRGVAVAAAVDDIRFVPLDVVQLCQRRSARLRAETAVDMAPLGQTIARSAVSTHSIDLSATGLLCAGGTGFDVGDLVKFEMLLDDESPVRGVARVLRADADAAALDFKDVGPDERRRLSEHIITVKRRELEEEIRLQADRRNALMQTGVLLAPVSHTRMRGSGGLVALPGGS